MNFNNFLTKSLSKTWHIVCFQPVPKLGSLYTFQIISPKLNQLNSLSVECLALTISLIRGKTEYTQQILCSHLENRKPQSKHPLENVSSALAGTSNRDFLATKWKSNVNFGKLFAVREFLIRSTPSSYTKAARVRVQYRVHCTFSIAVHHEY